MILIDESRCPKNHPCPVVRVCPVGAIIQNDIFSAPRVDQEACIDCGACTSACATFVYSDAPVPVEAVVQSR